MGDYNLRHFTKHCIAIFKVFITLHVLSVIINWNFHNTGLIYSLRGASVEFFGLPIYQALLTYPFVMLFVLILDKELGSKGKGLTYWSLLLMTGFLEFIMFRKVSLFIFFVYLAFYHRKIFIITLFALGTVLIAYSEIAYILLERVFDTKGNIVFSSNREFTWIRSLNYLKDFSLFLFGNGINNHSHNYWLHSLTSHGIFYSLLIFLGIFYLLGNTIAYDKSVRKVSIIILLIVLLDWSVNVNLYQSYYSALIALLFANIAIKKNESKKKIMNIDN